ncbi:MAG TPA: sulfotransferase domain-containing protein [Rhabdochlamydiaceae bacterium]|jgi:hypothetical protein
MFLLRWILVCFYCASAFCSQTYFLGVSIPKSGTHLLVKLFKLMTDCSYVGGWNGRLTEAQVDNLLLNVDFTKNYPFCHANEPHYLNFAKKHPEYVKLFQIRDLRDALVSAAFYFEAELEELGCHTFDEKLAFVLTSNTVYSNWVENNVKLFSTWISLPNTYVIRFEDLVGEKGGGSGEKQKETITWIHSLLNKDLSQEKLDWIIDHLFGFPGDKVSWSFRKGYVGDWKLYFQEHHKRLFNQRWGKYQQTLGYSIFE